MEELNSTMTMTEYRQWMEYESLEPFGSVREDWRVGFMLAVIANMIKGKNQKAFNPLDFSPESVHKWFQAIKEAGEGHDRDLSKTTGGEQVQVPVHPNIVIFEEMMKDHHVNDSGTQY